MGFAPALTPRSANAGFVRFIRAPRVRGSERGVQSAKPVPAPRGVDPLLNLSLSWHIGPLVQVSIVSLARAPTSHAKHRLSVTLAISTSFAALTSIRRTADCSRAGLGTRTVKTHLRRPAAGRLRTAVSRNARMTRSGAPCRRWRHLFVPRALFALDGGNVAGKTDLHILLGDTAQLS